MKWLGVLALIVGLFLFFATDNLKFSQSPSTTLGKLESVEGEVLVKGSKDSFFSPVKSGQALSDNMKIMTSFDSRTMISFGENFLLKASSMVRLEKVDKQYQVHILSGGVNRKAIGKTLFFANGEQQNQKEINIGGVVELTQIPIQEVSLNVESSEKSPQAFNKRQIYQTFKLHQRFIEKCFIKHYSRQNGQTQSGKVWVVFNVFKKGKLESPQIDKSDFSDKLFHDCLKEVVSRVQMKNYKGPTMQIKFPINIELPE